MRRPKVSLENALTQTRLPLALFSFRSQVGGRACGSDFTIWRRGGCPDRKGQRPHKLAQARHWKEANPRAGQMAGVLIADGLSIFPIPQKVEKRDEPISFLRGSVACHPSFV